MVRAIVLAKAEVQVFEEKGSDYYVAPQVDCEVLPMASVEVEEVERLVCPSVSLRWIQVYLAGELNCMIICRRLAYPSTYHHPSLHLHLLSCLTVIPLR